MDNSTDLSIMQIALGDYSGPLKVLQLSDCHLGDKEGEKLVGVDTDESLDHVLDAIQREQPHARLMLATGDLSNNGIGPAYTRLVSKLARLQLPYAWLSGNHDSRAAMIKTVGEELLPRAVRIGNWGIVMLDSAVAGRVGGELGADEIAVLQDTLQALSGAEHLLVCLHHPPMSIGCDWLDQQQLADSAELFAVLAGEPRLRAVIWGHVHQEFVAELPQLPNVKLMSAPSTCVQFAPNSPDFKLDTLAPGYRWLELHSDGRIDSGVSRVDGLELSIDFESTGY